MDLRNQTVELRITEVQQQSPTPHFYGQLLHEGTWHKIRIFPGPRDQPDVKIAQLLNLTSHDLADSGLRLKCFISDHFPDRSVKWSGRVVPLIEQGPEDQKMVEHLLDVHAQQMVDVVPRSPSDVVKADGYSTEKITSSKQPNQTELLGIAAYEGRNPMELLTGATARCQGKTDYALLVVLRVVAEKFDCEVCDLINEVMWESVKSGRVWRCNPDNGMP